MPTQIFLIRHGETAWSLSGQHTGRKDVPLTANGERQASELRERLANVAFDHVYTSPLQRARRTCELAGYSAVARVDSDVQEWDYGDDEGLTRDAIRERRPNWQIFRDGCPSGESVDDISLRADRVISRIRELDGTLAIFSHGHFLRVLAMRWIGVPVVAGQHFLLDTASISLLRFEHGNPTAPAIERWNTRASFV